MWDEKFLNLIKPDSTTDPDLVASPSSGPMEVGWCAQGSGSATQLAYEDFSTPPSSGFSLGIWFRAYNAPTNEFIWTLGNDSTDYPAVYMYAPGGNSLDVFLNDNSSSDYLGSSPTLTVGRWYWAVCVIEQGGATQRLYINGDLDAQETTNTFSFPWGSYVPRLAFSGRPNNYGSGDASVGAGLALGAYWSRPLTQAEAAMHPIGLLQRDERTIMGILQSGYTIIPGPVPPTPTRTVKPSRWII